VTATGIAEAASNADGRIDYMAKEFADSVSLAMTTVAWDMWHSHFFRQKFGQDAVDEFGATGEFVGGVDEESPVEFEDLDINVIIRSIGHTNDALIQKRANDRLITLSNIAPIIPQTPHMDWTNMLDDYGNDVNDEGLGRYVDMSTAQQLTEIQLASGEEPDIEKVPIPKSGNRFSGQETGLIQREANNA
jgi:hypothetical protein